MNKKIIIIVALAGAIIAGLWLKSYTIKKCYGSETNSALEMLVERVLVNVKNGKAIVDTEKWENENKILIKQGLYSLSILSTGMDVYCRNFYIVFKKLNCRDPYTNRITPEWEIKDEIKYSHNKILCEKIGALYDAGKYIIKKKLLEEKIKNMEEARQKAFPIK